MQPTPDASPGRFHVLLTADGRTVQHGWWASEATARRKWTAWIGEYGSLPDARISLADEEAGETIADWPGVVGGAE